MSGIELLNRFLAAYKFSLPLDQVRNDPNLSCLFDLGILEWRETGASGMCNACDVQHTVKIGIDPVTDKLGWRCPEAGFVEATSDQLRTVRLIPNAMAGWIAGALQCQRRKTAALVENVLWKVGWYEFQGNDVNVYLATRMRDAEDAGAIAAALQAEAGLRNGLVISPDVSGANGLTISGCRFAAIDDVINVGSDGLSCDRSRVAELAGVIVISGSGRRRHKRRSEVAEIIRQFHSEKRLFPSKRAAAIAIGEAMKALHPASKPPGRTVIEDEIDCSEGGCFLVG